MASIRQSKDIIISIDGKPVCAQKKIDIDRSANSIDITSKIDSSWARNLAGTKSWKVDCSGVFVVNDLAFSALEKAFNEGLNVDVEIRESGLNYKGSAIITSFPIGIDYEDAVTYRLKLLGDGPLVSEV